MVKPAVVVTNASSLAQASPRCAGRWSDWIAVVTVVAATSSRGTTITRER